MMRRSTCQLTLILRNQRRVRQIHSMRFKKSRQQDQTLPCSKSQDFTRKWWTLRCRRNSFRIRYLRHLIRYSQNPSNRSQQRQACRQIFNLGISKQVIYFSTRLSSLSVHLLSISHLLFMGSLLVSNSLGSVTSHSYQSIRCHIPLKWSLSSTIMKTWPLKRTFASWNLQR